MPSTTRPRSAYRELLDDLKRLAGAGQATLSERLRPLRVIEGSVTTDRANRLVYDVAGSRDGADGFRPRRITLDGAWRLNADHELELRLAQAESARPRTLTLRGAIVQAKANHLLFALRGQDTGAFVRAQRLALSGRWQADRHNRLTFLVEKSRGEEDRLTLAGAWAVGTRHELLYRYRQRSAGRPNEHTLMFRGAWDIAGANRLVYRLSGSSDSAFEFSASVQSRALQAREGRLAYQVGIRTARGSTHRERVALFGAWKLHKDASVSFEVPYADGRIQAIRLEGAVALGPREQAAVALRTRRGEPLGLTLTLTRQMTRDAGLFVQARRNGEERSIMGGVRIRF